MSRSRGLLLVLAAWFAIFLTRLGTLEIKGEEGRRILPAVTMLQDALAAPGAREVLRSFIVPQVGSDPYFSKPPLVNWLVASSFQLLGLRNEWAARLPSALCVLAVAIAFLTVARRALGPKGSIIGALVWLTNFGIIEKGRLIEIEALYASLCGLAVICWLSWWQVERSKWLTWIVPWIFLGLGLLAKGPLLLVFFYAVIGGVLYQGGALRRLWNMAHLIGLVLMVGIFAAWAIPCLHLMQQTNVTHTWARQFSGRLSGRDFDLTGWLLNIPRGLAYFLPWVLLLAFAKRALVRDEATEHRRSNAADRKSTFDLRIGLVWGIGLSFLGVSLLPGSLPRYTMPLLAPASWLIAMLLTTERFHLPRRLQPRRPSALSPELRLPVFVAGAVCLAIGIYAFALMPLMLQRQKVRTVAAQINAALPAAETLYAVDPDYQPFLFYVRDPIAYVNQISDLPGDAHYLLVQPAKEQQATASTQWQPRKAAPILRLRDYRNKEVVLLEVDAP